MTAIYNLQRVIGMRGTKAQVEAFTGTLEEQAVGYATDTGEVGVYTNGAWSWITVSLALDDLTDVNAPSPNSGDVLSFDGSVWRSRDPNQLIDKAWGSMYQDDVGTIITVGATDTDYIADGMSVGVVGNMAFQNEQELLIELAGVYQVVWSVSFTTAGNNQEIEGAVGIGGVRQPQTSAHTRKTTASDTTTMSGTGLIEVAVNDLVQIVLRNETATSNITVEHANLSLVFLGVSVGGAMLLESGDLLLLESGDSLLLED